MNVTMFLRLISGSVMFALIQWALALMPVATFQPPPAGSAWFLDSGLGVGLVVGGFFLLGVVWMPPRPDAVPATAVPVVIGGAVALVAAWFVMDLESNIFPIVFGFGIGMLAVSTLGGAWIASEIRQRLGPRE